MNGRFEKPGQTRGIKVPFFREVAERIFVSGLKADKRIETDDVGMMAASGTTALIKIVFILLGTRWFLHTTILAQMFFLGEGEMGNGGIGNGK